MPQGLLLHWGRVALRPGTGCQDSLGREPDSGHHRWGTAQQGEGCHLSALVQQTTRRTAFPKKRRLDPARFPGSTPTWGTYLASSSLTISALHDSKLVNETLKQNPLNNAEGTKPSPRAVGTELPPRGRLSLSSAWVQSAPSSLFFSLPEGALTWLSTMSPNP